MINSSDTKGYYGNAAYRDGIVEVLACWSDDRICIEIRSESLDEMLPSVRKLALQTQDEINQNGHADAKPKQDNAQICEAVYRAVRQAMKNMEL